MANYSANPTLDSELVSTILHESFLMKTAFDEFEYWGRQQIADGLSDVDKVRLFSSYCSFLHHLYEFCIACFKRDQGSDQGFSGKGSDAKRDSLITAEAHRIFAGRKRDIENGMAPAWVNDISYYDVKIPADFAEKWRRIRNSTAHAISDRAAGKISLTDFYRDYHKYIVEVYRSAISYWGRFDIGQVDLKEIRNFSVIVHK